MAESNSIKNQFTPPPIFPGGSDGVGAGQEASTPAPQSTRTGSSARIHGLVPSSTQNGDPHREESLQQLNVNVETPRLPPRSLSLVLFSHRKLPSLWGGWSCQS